MATLADIIEDPNYVNANAATKQAIFDKYAAQDSNYTKANAATQEAIRVKFGVAQPRAAEPEVPKPRAAESEVPGPRTQQGVWQTVRPWVAEGVPMATSLGLGIYGGIAGLPGFVPGSMAGAASGAVLGAGLGAGIGKELVELGDIYLGGKAPRAGAARITEPVSNIAAGAAAEAGGRVVGPVIARGLDWARRAPERKAAKMAINALGEDLPAVINALRAAEGTGVTAGQATADITSPTWQALMQRAVERDPRFLQLLQQSQGDVSINALNRLAGGATAADIRQAQELAKQTLTDITSPARQAALASANKGADVARLEQEAAELSGAAADKVAEVRRLIKAGDLAEAAARLEVIRKGVPVGMAKYTYKGELAGMADEWASKAADASLDLGQGARFAQSAADSLKAAGIKPLKSDALIANIQSITKNPEFAANPEIAAATSRLASDIAEWTGKGGVIDAVALDAIRKNSINAAIQQLHPGKDATSQRNLAAGVMAKVRPMIVDAIEASGGKGYRAYLEEYSTGMQEIAKQKLTGEARRLWTTDKDAFVRLVQNESPDAVEKILGPGKYNIASELAENTMQTLREQAKKHLTDLAVARQAKGEGTQKVLAELLQQNLSLLRVPSRLSVITTVTNDVLRKLEDKIGTKTMAALTEAAKSPGGAANLLEKIPADLRPNLIQIISDPARYAAPRTGGLSLGARRAAEAIRSGIAREPINALLRDSQQNQNALAQ
jgi:hypothetical protein